ncbi:MAG: hypothetical protein AABY86_15155, partial [Bdellovibrionota bacterium]
KGEMLASDNTYIVVKSLDAREYKWRVRAIDRQRPDNEWSEYRNFMVTDFKESNGQIRSGPTRRREFYEESSGEWKKKER